MRFTIDKEQFLKGLLIAGRGIGDGDDQHWFGNHRIQW